MKSAPFLALVIGGMLTIACSSRRPVPPGTPDDRIERSIYGQWNCIDVQPPGGRSLGIPYELLNQNEQGFEFRERGIYLPRYYDGQSHAYSTNYNINGYWGVQEGKYLFFSDRSNEVEAPDFTWEILRLTEQEFWLKDHQGNTVKLRRQDI